MFDLVNLKLWLLLITLIQWSDSYQGDDDNQQDDLTVNLKDPWGYQAIKTIHNKIDYDQNGSIDRRESVKFIVSDLKINEGSEADKKEMSLHGGDNSISVDEMWDSWRKSQVSKWSVDETVDWLINHVKLPQYTINFIENHIDGSRLPRIAANPAFATHILKITDPLDRQRLTLSAIEAVLFGVSSDHFLLDQYLITLLITVSFILWFVLNQRRNVQRRLDKVFRQMSTLQESRDKLLSIQRELEKTKEGKKQLLDETENLNSMLKSSGDSGGGQRESLKEKESNLIKEIAATRLCLAQAEQMLLQTPVERIQQQKLQLQRWLQITYEIENKIHNEQKTQYEVELIKLKNMFLGKRKRSLRRTSGSYYEELKATRLRLTGLINQIEICRDKWIKIENMCGFSIRDNPGLVALQQAKSSPSFSRMTSMIDDSETSEREEESYTPSPATDGDFFPDFHMLLRPSSRTSDYSTPKRNSSAKQLRRLLSHDESMDIINKYPLRSTKSTYIDKSSPQDPMVIKYGETNLMTKSLTIGPNKRQLIRRSSSLQDILFRMPNQGLSKQGADTDLPAEI